MCRTCAIVKPPRSFHCSNCKACIEVHDHHCPWVGTCVGKRNHKYFLLFGIFTSVHATLTLILDCFYLKLRLFVDENPQTEKTKSTVAMFLLIYTALITLCVGGLSCYHGKLAAGGQTTNEEMRGKYSNGNPYDEGCRQNCRIFCHSGTSRIYSEHYSTEELSKKEANVFVIRSKIPAHFAKRE